MKIPFKSKEQSTLVSEVLGVDKELKGSGINKTININDDGLLVLVFLLMIFIKAFLLLIFYYITKLLFSEFLKEVIIRKFE